MVPDSENLELKPGSVTPGNEPGKDGGNEKPPTEKPPEGDKKPEGEKPPGDEKKPEDEQDGKLFLADIFGLETGEGEKTNDETNGTDGTGDDGSGSGDDEKSGGKNADEKGKKNEKEKGQGSEGGQKSPELTKKSGTDDLVDEEVDEEKEIDTCIDIATNEFKKKYGREPDEFSNKDSFRLNETAGKIRNFRNHQRVVVQKWKETEKELIPLVSSPEVAKFIDEEVNSISVREARQLSEKASQGDFGLYADVVKRAVKKYNDSKGKKPTDSSKKEKANERVKEISTQRQRDNPPALNGGGSPSRNDSEPDEGLAMFGLNEEGG